MAWASDGPASSADLGWRSKDLTELHWKRNVGYWSGEGFRANGNRTRVIRELSTTLYRLVRKVKVAVRQVSACRFSYIWKGATENLGSYSIKKLHVGKHQILQSITLVVMRNTCQVTNQSSHGELSSHHNPHLRSTRSLGLSTFRVIRRGGSRLKHAAHLHTVIAVSYAR